MTIYRWSPLRTKYFFATKYEILSPLFTEGMTIDELIIDILIDEFFLRTTVNKISYPVSLNFDLFHNEYTYYLSRPLHSSKKNTCHARIGRWSQPL